MVNDLKDNCGEFFRVMTSTQGLRYYVPLPHIRVFDMPFLGCFKRHQDKSTLGLIHSQQETWVRSLSREDPCAVSNEVQSHDC